MKSASLLSRLSAIFIDLIIWSVLIVLFVIIGIKLDTFLKHHTHWYSLEWTKQVKTIPYNKYIVSGDRKQLDKITRIYPTDHFDFNINNYSLRKLHELVFDIGFLKQSKAVQRQIIRSLCTEIYQDQRFIVMKASEKSRFLKALELHINKMLGEDIGIFDENKTFPSSDSLQTVVLVPISKEHTFLTKTQKLSITTSNLKRYYVDGLDYYLQDKDVTRFLMFLSGKGLYAYLAVPDFADFEVSSIDFNFLASVLIIILYSLICVFFLLLSWALFESSKMQGTPGKMLLHVKVVDEEGNRIPYDLAFKRGFYRLYSILILGIGYLHLFGKSHRTLHDVWSKTWVVEK